MSPITPSLKDQYSKANVHAILHYVENQAWGVILGIRGKKRVIPIKKQKSIGLTLIFSITRIPE